MFQKSTALILSGILLIGAVSAAHAEHHISDAIQAAVANPERPETDRELDSWRKPTEVLTFLGIEPGMTVLDILSGDGYYSEILSNLVGPQGRVISHNDWLYYTFIKDGLPGRYKDHRLTNVLPVLTDLSDLALEDESLDAAFLGLAFHDLFWSPEDKRPEKVDIPASLANLYALMKPGAVVGITDHYAPAGMNPVKSVVQWHRVDPEVIKSLMQDAGFVFEEEADFLRNPEDPIEISVFDPSIRGKTDRFVLRFRKPAM